MSPVVSLCHITSLTPLWSKSPTAATLDPAAYTRTLRSRLRHNIALSAPLSDRLALLPFPEDRVPVIFVGLSDRLLTLASAVILGSVCLGFSRGFSLCVGLWRRRGFFLRVLFRLGLFVVRHRLSYSPSSWALHMTPENLCLAIHEDAFRTL